jgi:Tfp pilus assembly protein PilX
LATAFVSAAALGMMLSSALLRFTVANTDDATALFNAAEAALELAARELALVDLTAALAGAETSPLVDGPIGPRIIGGETIDLEVLTNQLTCGRTSLCSNAQVRQVTGERPWGANNPRWQPFLYQQLAPPDLPRRIDGPYVVVWIGDDGRETDENPLADGEGAGEEGRYVVRARAEAFGPRGGRRAIEAELARLCAMTANGVMCVPGTHVQSWRAVLTDVP